MRAHPGRVIVKVGAEGVYSGLLVREGWGIALKVEDGHTTAAELAITAVLSVGLRPQPRQMSAAWSPTRAADGGECVFREV
jgi:L-asparaginase II